MSNPWFRLHTDFLNNPKVQILTEALRYRYVALLCLRCNGDYENRPDDEIALSLRVTVEEWIFARNEFIKRDLLTPEFEIKGWEKRQYISDIKDPTAADRQKRYRDNKRNNRNASVTSRLPEADTDTDKKEKNIKKDDLEFLYIWELYDFKNDKKESEKVFNTYRKHYQAICQAIPDYKNYLKATGYPPCSLAVWLRKERYNNDYKKLTEDFNVSKSKIGNGGAGYSVSNTGKSQSERIFDAISGIAEKS